LDSKRSIKNNASFSEDIVGSGVRVAGLVLVGLGVGEAKGVSVGVFVDIGVAMVSVGVVAFGVVGLTDNVAVASSTVRGVVGKVGLV
jgi:hypothetical protein